MQVPKDGFVVEINLDLNFILKRKNSYFIKYISTRK